MKKLIMPIAAVLLMTSCQKESAEAIENQDEAIDVAKIQALVDDGYNDVSDVEGSNAFKEAYESLNESELELFFELHAKSEVERLDKATGIEHTAYEKQLYYDNMLEGDLKVLKLAKDTYGRPFNLLSDEEVVDIYSNNTLDENFDVVSQILHVNNNLEDDFEGVDFLNESDFETTGLSKSSCTYTAAARKWAPWTTTKGNRAYKGYRIRRWGGDPECEYMVIYHENRSGHSHLDGFNTSRFNADVKRLRSVSYKIGWYNNSRRWYVQLGTGRRISPSELTAVLSSPGIR